MMMMPPSAIAGDRVNRECYMQVRERGCTTPALAYSTHIIHLCAIRNNFSSTYNTTVEDIWKL